MNHAGAYCPMSGAGYVLVRGSDAFMRPAHPGGVFYWGQHGTPHMWPTLDAATKAANMQGGTVVFATDWAQLLIQAWRDANPDIVECWNR